RAEPDMSARDPTARPFAKLRERALDRDALAAVLVCHAPRGAVHVAEALAATAINRRRRAERVWNGALADWLPRFDALFGHSPQQPISARADAPWNAACRRIAARALAGAGLDRAGGGQFAVCLGAPAPPDAPVLTARVGPFAFYRSARDV